MRHILAVALEGRRTVDQPRHRLGELALFEGEYAPIARIGPGGLQVRRESGYGHPHPVDRLGRNERKASRRQAVGGRSEIVVGLNHIRHNELLPYLTNT